ncbi:hypothetical protein EJ03DRAFT_142457 [Teratosphaeria nubilosa]|uniref:Uncharacterized protein n=1 Tax=Teratosphaeria nubilosa TaxID=161662 RepID=A0A6G1L5M3_9PEZI|nr:hypothetical protein EJ03DRAFT_142457 [Teratosphaeria nubilosa]
MYWMKFARNLQFLGSRDRHGTAQHVNQGLELYLRHSRRGLEAQAGQTGLQARLGACPARSKRGGQAEGTYSATSSDLALLVADGVSTKYLVADSIVTDWPEPGAAFWALILTSGPNACQILHLRGLDVHEQDADWNSARGYNLLVMRWGCTAFQHGSRHRIRLRSKARYK